MRPVQKWNVQPRPVLQRLVVEKMGIGEQLNIIGQIAASLLLPHLRKNDNGSGVQLSVHVLIRYL